MNKIKAFKDVKALVKKMLANPELKIQIWDQLDTSRIISVEPNPEYELWCFVTIIDTVEGTEERIEAYITDVEDSIWNNRKDVNKLNDLAGL